MSGYKLSYRKIATDPSTTLLNAIKKGKVEEIKKIIGEHPNLKSQPFKTNDGDNGRTPILIAAYFGQLEVVKWLKENGVSLKEKDIFKHTTLIMAGYGGQIKTIDWLLEQKLSLQDKDKHGNTPFLASVSSGKMDAMQHLLKKDEAQLSDKNKYGDTALALAAYNGHFDTVEKLIELTKHSLKEEEISKAYKNAKKRGHKKIEIFLGKRLDGSFSGSSSISSSALTETKLRSPSLIPEVPIAQVRDGATPSSSINPPVTTSLSTIKQQSLDLEPELGDTDKLSDRIKSLKIEIGSNESEI